MEDIPSLPSSIFVIPGEPAIVINEFSELAQNSTSANYLSNVQSKDDPGLGKWLEGRDVRKMFIGQYYSGKVMKFDEETNWYRVVYEDGDFEDLEWHELEEVLQPIDIAISLKDVALKLCKSHKSIKKLPQWFMMSDSSKSRGISRGKHKRTTPKTGRTFQKSLHNSEKKRSTKTSVVPVNGKERRRRTSKKSTFPEVSPVQNVIPMDTNQTLFAKTGEGPYYMSLLSENFPHENQKVSEKTPTNSSEKQKRDKSKLISTSSEQCSSKSTLPLMEEYTNNIEPTNIPETQNLIDMVEPLTAQETMITPIKTYTDEMRETRTETRAQIDQGEGSTTISLQTSNKQNEMQQIDMVGEQPE